MFITKQEYIAYPTSWIQPGGSIAAERNGLYNPLDGADHKPLAVAFFTKMGRAVCVDGRFAKGEVAPCESSLSMAEKAKRAEQALRDSGLRYRGGFVVCKEAPDLVDKEDLPTREDLKYPTREYAEQSLAREIAQKEAELRKIREELAILRGLVGLLGNKIKV